MFGDSALNLNLLLFRECGEQLGLDISLMMWGDSLWVSRRRLEQMHQYLWMDSSSYLRLCRLDVVVVCFSHPYLDLQILHIVVYSHSWISCFWGVVSFCLLLSLISIYVGLYSLVFKLVVQQPSLKAHWPTYWYSNELDRENIIDHYILNPWIYNHYISLVHQKVEKLNI